MNLLTNPTRTPLKYPGAKSRIASWIVSHFPEFFHSYVEPYAGSAAVLFEKSPSNIETINDLDLNVVNLFEVIQKFPEELIRRIENTPYSRYLYDKTWETVVTDKDTMVDKAVSFLIKSWQGHGFRNNKYKVGWKNDIQGRESAYAVRNWNNLPHWLSAAAQRLKQVQIECRPALEVIEKFNHPNVLIYADPPYVLSTRKGLSYNHEMTDDEHVDLLIALKKHKGYVLLSGYDNEIYSDLLSDWSSVSCDSFAEGGAKRVEKIWMNYLLQPTLFNFMNTNGNPL